MKRKACGPIMWMTYKSLALFLYYLYCTPHCGPQVERKAKLSAFFRPSHELNTCVNKLYYILSDKLYFFIFLTSRKKYKKKYKKCESWIRRSHNWQSFEIMCSLRIYLCLIGLLF